MSPVQLLGGDPVSIGDPAVFGVITVSDRASSGVYEDLSGPAILKFFHEAIQSPWTAKYAVIPDEQPIIEQTIKDMVSANRSSSSSSSNSSRVPVTAES
jgi:molybdopterin adenylyltransferase